MTGRIARRSAHPRSRGERGGVARRLRRGADLISDDQIAFAQRAFEHLDEVAVVKTDGERDGLYRAAVGDPDARMTASRGAIDGIRLPDRGAAGSETQRFH